MKCRRQLQGKRYQIGRCLCQPGACCKYLFQRLFKRWFPIFPLFLLSNISSGQVIYQQPGAIYQQNFDSLPAQSGIVLSGKGPFLLEKAPFNIPSLLGWQILQSAGSSPNANFNIATGSVTGSGIYSMGIGNEKERSLGSLASSTGIYAYGIVFNNQTGKTLESCQISFSAEQWRKGGSGNKNTWVFGYSVGQNLSVANSNYQTDSNLNIQSLHYITGAQALVGNLIANQQHYVYQLKNIHWLPGQDLVLKWTDTDDGSSDDLMAMDQFSFTAFPTTTKNDPHTQILQINQITNESASILSKFSFDSTQVLSEFGIVWAVHKNPTAEDHKQVATENMDTLFTTIANQLPAGEILYVKAYARQDGVYFYSPLDSFKTSILINSFKADTLVSTNRDSIYFLIESNKTITGLRNEQFLLDTCGVSNAKIIAIQTLDLLNKILVFSGKGSGKIGLTLLNDSGINYAIANLPISSSTFAIIDKDRPQITAIVAPSKKIYYKGDSLVYSVHFSENILLKDTSKLHLPLTLNMQNKKANYQNKSGDNQLQFKYTIQPGDIDPNGVTRGDSLSGMLACITDSAGNPANLILPIDGLTDSIIIGSPPIQFSNKNNQYLSLCNNQTKVNLSKYLSVIKESMGEQITWEFSNNQTLGNLSKLNDTAFSSGQSMEPLNIIYEPLKHKIGVDTLLIKVRSGEIQQIKSIFIQQIPNTSNNLISGNQLICNQQNNLLLKGEKAFNENSNIGYLWETSIDSVNFIVAPGLNYFQNYQTGKIPATTWFRRKAIAGNCIDTSNILKITKLENGLWIGKINDDWHNKNNWCNELIPTKQTTVYITAESKFNPIIYSMAEANNLQIESASLLKIKDVLSIAGTIQCNAACIDAMAGKIILAGNEKQLISGNEFVNKTIAALYINNQMGASLTDSLFIQQALTLNRGTFYTNNLLIFNRGAILGASSLGSNLIGESIIHPTINTTKNTFTLISNPFKNDITTHTLSPNIKTIFSDSVLYSYQSDHTDDSIGFHQGWANLFLKDKLWQENQTIGFPNLNPAIRNIAASSLFIQLQGNLKIGKQVFLLSKQKNPNYHLIGNPYLSNINLKLLSRGEEISRQFWVWNPQQAKGGGYTSYPFFYHYILAPLENLFVKSFSNQHNEISFTENVKTVESTSTLYFKQEDRNALEIRLESNGIFFDRLLLFQSDTAKVYFDRNDAEKFQNPIVNFYSLSKENKALSIDARPINNQSQIQLGIQTKEAGKFELRIFKNELVGTPNLYLHDKIEKKWLPLISDSSYSFYLDGDSGYLADQRFEIINKNNYLEFYSNSDDLNLKIGPIPSMDYILYQFTAPSPAASKLSIYNMSGNLILSKNLGVIAHKKESLPIKGLSTGMYILEICCGAICQQQKFFRQ